MNPDDAFHAAHDPAPLAGRRILVVDDEEDVRTFLLTVFADAGAEICEAADGDEALAVATALHPDLITLDLSMPGHDGIQAFGDLRHAAETRDIPICVVTGHPEFRRVIYDRSDEPPEGFMTKPVDPDELVHTLRRILALADRRAERRVGRSEQPT
jgi:CheY-like chemotaxis protein